MIANSRSDLDFPAASSVIGDTIRTLQLGMGWFPERHGGLDRYYHELLHHLPDARVKVRGVVCGLPDIEQQSAGVVRSAARPNAGLHARFIGFRQCVRQEMVKFNPHVVVAHFALYARPTLDCFADKPLVVHFHGPWHRESRLEGGNRVSRWAKHRFERTVYRRANRLITLSGEFKNVLIRDFKIDPERIVVIPGGVNTRRFDIRETKQQAREKLNWPKDRPIVLAVRRLTRRMGLENLIDAAALVHTQHPDALILIAGSGQIRNELQDRIVAANLTDHVKLLGRLCDDDLPLAYRAADLTVVPSIALEGFGLVAAESLAAGTPALVTPVGGLPEIVEPLCADLIATGTRIEDLAGALVNTLSHPGRLPTGSQCMKYVGRYDWSTVAGEIRSVLKSVL